MHYYIISCYNIIPSNITYLWNDAQSTPVADTIFNRFIIKFNAKFSSHKYENITITLRNKCDLLTNVFFFAGKKNYNICLSYIYL